MYNIELVPWHSVHHIRLMNRRPGFKYRQGICNVRDNIAMLLCTPDLKCVVDAFKLEICTVIWHNKYILKFIIMMSFKTIAVFL
jgi:hypothetical protein